MCEYSITMTSFLYNSFLSLSDSPNNKKLLQQKKSVRRYRQNKKEANSHVIVKMAEEREPPPFEDEDSQKDDDDLFAEANEEQIAEPPVKEPEVSQPARIPVKPDIDSNDLFGDDGEDVKLDSDEDEQFDETEEPKPGTLAATVKTTPIEVTTEPEPPAPQPVQEETPKLPVSQTSTSSSSSKVTSTTKHKNDEYISPDYFTFISFVVENKTKEEGDQYTIDIKVTEPHKMGDGMGAYMVYRVITKTSIPAFRRPELSVIRRFSDFLGLHDKLAEKHVNQGVIVPPAPEKSVIGMTKVKISKEESGSSEFIERRRAALERYLNRTASHPTLRIDPDFRDFLERDGELPKSTSTSALSGAGVMRLFHKVGDAVQNITFKMDEADEVWKNEIHIDKSSHQSKFKDSNIILKLCGCLSFSCDWFEERQQQIESLDQQLRKLHSNLSSCTASFAKSAAMLGNAEEHTALSRALSQLAETEEKIEVVQREQADNDFYIMAELLKDYIALLGAVKDVFHERVKCYKNWKEAESMLTKKRENKVKLELAHKNDKIAQAEAEIKEWQQKVEKGQEDFERISDSIRKEVARFDKYRVEDFKSGVIKYLETLMENQQKLIKYWETFLPEAKAIA
ncbi:hypothetical protein KUTeg_017824 [Tegillarca granosa]|uniref:PX domain-containing protein n=1 Tax=Tegillarca granosa TaxID=220873 RepID=A0ABQ9EK24_TEGGR|nr:hypothetical protein KUTeg_017824 [Tegillarca granosa]